MGRKLRDVLVLLWMTTVPALAAPASPEGQAFCQRVRDPDSFKAAMLEVDNRLAFTNHGGLLHGGVCWWHSRFQRSATYLTVFRPDLPKPTNHEAMHLIDEIIFKRKVVEIPGYANLAEFSEWYEPLIQKRLEEWQIFDGFVEQQWIDGLAGATRLSAAHMRARIEELFHAVEDKHRIVFIKLQIPGISAHAMNVVHVVPVDGGYQLQVIDSNHLAVQTIDYKFGDRELWQDFYRFVPYIEHQGDYGAFRRAIRGYCGEQGSERSTETER